MRIAALFLGSVVFALLTIAMLFTAGWTRPPIVGQQIGYRGVAMDQITTPAAVRRLKLANALPDAIPPASPEGPRAVDVYKNVQILTDLSVDQFNTLMAAITTWVAPKEGCAYCHNIDKMEDDGIYAKKVSRRMLQMTRHINTDWKTHVQSTGVVCWTCHRGQPVPADVWYENSGWPHAGGFTATNDGMGHPDKANGWTAMSQDPYTPLLEKGGVITSSGDPGPSGRASARRSSRPSRPTALMMAISTGLGVNCTFCHNTREFGQWPESTPQRVTAWHGIQMVRDLNDAYLDPLKDIYPANRLGRTRRCAQGELRNLPPGRQQAAARRQPCEGLSGARWSRVAQIGSPRCATTDRAA